MTIVVRQRRAFSLIEVLMSIFILGIGVIAIASLLPAGIKQQQNAKNDAYGPVVADSALATLRSRFSPADFGGDDQLRDTTAPDELRASVLNFFQYLPTGDFEWTRPAWWYGEASGNPSPLVPPSLRRGAVHPFIGPIGLPSFDTFWIEGATDGFGRNFTGVTAAVVGAVNLLANPAVFPRYEESSPFNGIPPGVFDYQVNNQDPAANIDLHYFLSREDRSWPQDSDTPEYYWDCAFQRSNGTVQVAIFVYRATEPDGKRLVDRPTDILSAGGGSTVSGSPQRPHAVHLDEPWVPGQRVIQIASGTPSPFDTTGSGDAYLDRQWQAGGQWILDEHGNVHRVIRGRNTANELVVELYEPVPAVRRTSPYSPTFWNDDPNYPRLGDPADPNRPPLPTVPPESIGALNRSDEQLRYWYHTVDRIWFVPVTDRSGRRIEPVYVTVREL